MRDLTQLHWTVTATSPRGITQRHTAFFLASLWGAWGYLRDKGWHLTFARTKTIWTVKR
jgi:hypothetical protein